MGCTSSFPTTDDALVASTSTAIVSRSVANYPIINSNSSTASTSSVIVDDEISGKFEKQQMSKTWDGASVFSRIKFGKQRLILFTNINDEDEDEIIFLKNCSFNLLPSDGQRHFLFEIVTPKATLVCSAESEAMRTKCIDWICKANPGLKRDAEEMGSALDSVVKEVDVSEINLNLSSSASTPALDMDGVWELGADAASGLAGLGGVLAPGLLSVASEAPLLGPAAGILLKFYQVGIFKYPYLSILSISRNFLHLLWLLQTTTPQRNSHLLNIFYSKLIAYSPSR